MGVVKNVERLGGEKKSVREERSFKVQAGISNEGVAYRTWTVVEER